MDLNLLQYPEHNYFKITWVLRDYTSTLPVIVGDLTPINGVEQVKLQSSFVFIGIDITYVSNVVS